LGRKNRKSVGGRFSDAAMADAMAGPEADRKDKEVAVSANPVGRPRHSGVADSPVVLALYLPLGLACHALLGAGREIWT
jgi:hypothetical protein